MKTYAVKASEIEHSWWVVDATDQTLGRLATRAIAMKYSSQLTRASIVPPGGRSLAERIVPQGSRARRPGEATISRCAPGSPWPPSG